jgi:NADH-quinone oxidoreductase subunit J
MTGVLAAGPHVLAAAGSGGQTAAIWILGPISVLAALGLISVRKAVHSAMLLAVVMISLAVLYAVQDAPFLSAVQVIVYTGAVLMLFLFVVMIVGVSSTESMVETIRGQRVAAAVAGIAFVVLLLLGFGHATLAPTAGLKEANGQGGNVMGLAKLIFTKYIFAFEVTSALLITAALGAMVLAHRERLTPRPTQRQLSEARVHSDRMSPLPPPGTYARHNSVDMPALLPDGSVSELSVSPVIARRRGGTHDDLHGEGPEAVVKRETATLKAVLEGQVEVESQIQEEET